MVSLPLLRRLGLGALAVALVIILSGAAAAQAPLDFAHTLLVKRPLMEREVESQVSFRSGSSGRETVGTVALDLPLLPRWQIELALPVLSVQPTDAPSATGIGDLALENKFLLWAPPDRPLMFSAGVDVVMPTGSIDRHLGGTSGVAPFAVVGTKVVGVDILADITYQWLFDVGSPGRDTQIAQSTIAMARAVRPWLTPFIEMRVTTQVTGSELSTGPRVLDRPQLTFTPGLNITLARGRTLLLGIEIPVTHARTFDYGPRLGLVWDF